MADMVTPFCVEGCLDTDPAPEAVGYFFPGTENQWAHCADPAIDQDQDGLDDNCEYKLAHAFRPEMSTLNGDDTRGEPRWAAQWLGDESDTYTVRIAYLPSYWMDMGDGGFSEGWCDKFHLPFCEFHGGDSEWLRLDVKYNFVTQHWYLADAKYSAHDWHVDFSPAPDSSLFVSVTSDGGGPGLLRNYVEYPDHKKGGYPRAYGADGKHANYPTEAYCDGPGGEGGADDCAHPRILARFDVSQSNNLGSRSAPFINCVVTSRTDHPAYGMGYQECYWETRRFRGWFNPSAVGQGATSYGIILSNQFGF